MENPNCNLREQAIIPKYHPIVISVQKATEHETQLLFHGSLYHKQEI